MQRLRCCRSGSELLFVSRRELAVWDGVNGTSAHRSLPWPLLNAPSILSDKTAPEGQMPPKGSKGIPLWMLWLLLCAGQKRQETKIPCTSATSMPLAPFSHHTEHRSHGEPVCHHCALLAASDLKQRVGSQHPTPACRNHPVPSLFVGKQGG